MHIIYGISHDYAYGMVLVRSFQNGDTSIYVTYVVLC